MSVLKMYLQELKTLPLRYGQPYLSFKIGPGTRI